MKRARGVPGRLRQAIRHPISQNTVALYTVQVATFLVPLVTLPYLSRVLGPSAFGLVLFAQGFSFVLGLFIDFGFGASATRAVAKVRDDRDGLSGVVGEVFGAKFILVAATLAAAAIGYLAIEKLRGAPDFLVLAWVAAVAQGLSPGWFFVGIEQLRLVSLIQLGARVVAAALTFVWVTDAGDGWVVLALYAGASVITALVGIALMLRKVRLKRPKLAAVRGALRESSVLFVGTGALALYSSANVVLLGLFASAAQVAHFGAAERIVRAGVQLLGPVSTAVYPRIARLHSQTEHTRARRLSLIALGLLGGSGLLGALILIGFADPIIRLIYGPDFEDAVPLLELMAPILPLIAVSATLAGGWMLSLHLDKKVVRVALTAGVANVAFAIILAPLFGPVGMACGVLLAEIVAVTGFIRAVRSAEVPLLRFRRRAAKPNTQGEAGGV